jgi:hypothetical protein
VDDRDYCPECGRETQTIHGRCPNCLYVKRPDQVPAKRKYSRPLFADFDGFALRLLCMLPGLALIVLGVIIGWPALVYSGVGAMLFGLVIPWFGS